MTTIEQNLTVLDSPDFTVKHPLTTSWTLWFDTPAKKSPNSSSTDWNAQLHELGVVGTVEDFWGLSSNLHFPTELPLGSNYHFFR